MTAEEFWWLVGASFGAAGLALSGHGSIAWVAIRRFFARVRAYVDARVHEAELRIEHSAKEQAEWVRGQMEALWARVEALSASVGPSAAEAVTPLLAEAVAPVLARFDGIPLSLGPVVGAEVDPRLETLLARVPLAVGPALAESLRPLLEEQAESLKMSMLSAKASAERSVGALELELAEATDPTARAIVRSLGRRRGKKVLDLLEGARELDAQVHPELHETVK